jgi:hypothetical protein
MRLLFIIIIIGNSLLSFSQNFKEDLYKVGKAYDSHKNIYMDMVYKVFKNRNTSELIDVSYGYYQRNGNNYRNKISKLESVVTNDFTIYIDTLDKQIIYTKTLPQQKLAPIDLTNIDSLFTNYKKVEFLKSSNDHISYRVWLNNKMVDEIDYYEVDIDKKLNLFTKITLIYNREVNFSETEIPEFSKPRVEINFNHIKFNPKNDQGLFLLDHYITKKGSKLLPSINYQNFKVNII